jgi:magnesium chelatase family protein
VRVASALARLGVLLDEYAITVNLAPADLRKSGASLDLAIAVSVLGALGQLAPEHIHGVLLMGELSLEAGIRATDGVLPRLEGARALGVTAAVVPLANAAEAGLVHRMDVFVADTLHAVVDHLRGSQQLARAPRTCFQPQAAGSGGGDFTEVRGQPLARRALEVAAAGGHNLLMIGPPGGGKTMLARLLPTILPPLTFDEAIEITKIHSVARLLDAERGVVLARPFRAPHHSVSEAGLIGGGDIPRPGELSLAHRGVLFLDELAEFGRKALESLRQPLEDGCVCIARARARAWFPARPLVVGAVNPCPCGFRGHPQRSCRCSERLCKSYRARLSGPLIDRLDIHLSVPAVEVHALLSNGPGESSKAVRDRVVAAQNRQFERCSREGIPPVGNAALSLRELEQVASLDSEARRILESAMSQLGLSARAFVKVLRVARTIADLDESSRVRAPHVAEAIQGRLLDRDG